MQNEVKSRVWHSEIRWGWGFRPSDNPMSHGPALGAASQGPSPPVGRRVREVTFQKHHEPGQPQASREGHCPGPHVPSPALPSTLPCLRLLGQALDALT